MNPLIFISTFLFFSCNNRADFIATKNSINTTTQATIDTFKIDCTPPNLTNIIVRSDTTIDYKKYNGHLIQSYDTQNRLRQRLITNLYESNSKKIFSSTEIYDTVGHIIYENKTHEMICWHCYKYTYDNAGHLIEKSGYSSGELGIKISYIYNGNKLVKEITERLGQKNVKTY